jgi:16S rRNA (guanine(527)-N(7))-methyltransferase RsmG
MTFSFHEFEHSCKQHGIQLTEVQASQFQDYVNLLLDWNTRINLISRQDTGDIWATQIYHSILPWFLVAFPLGWKILDLGTGGGLPGIPLSILRPDLQLTLLDSIKKKTAAVGEMVGLLELQNVEVLTRRAEDLAKESRRTGSFDAVITRAVAPLEKLIRWSRPLLRVTQQELSTIVPADFSLRVLDRSCILAWKGGDLEGEIERARIKVREADIQVLHLPTSDSLVAGLEGKKIVMVRFTG